MQTIKMPLVMFGGLGTVPRDLDDLKAEIARIAKLAGMRITISSIRLPIGHRTIGGMVDALAAEVRRCRYKQIIVFGVSFGGAVVQEFARRYPKMVKKLIIASSCGGAPSFPGNPWAMMGLMAKSFMRPGKDRLSRREVLRRTAAIQLWSSWLWLHELRQPTLVLHGTNDTLVPAVNGQVLAHLIPNARLVLIPGGGHHTVLRDLEPVATAIVEFVIERSVSASVAA